MFSVTVTGTVSFTCREWPQDGHTARGSHCAEKQSGANGMPMTGPPSRADLSTPAVVLKFDPNVMHQIGRAHV